MTTTSAPPSSTTPRRSGRLPRAARWMITFAGFPLGAVAAQALVGQVGSTGSALLGGLVTGAVLGAVQAWALRRSGRAALAWVAATGLGLMVGLGIGSTLVGHRTDLTSLVVQGAVCGIAVGVGQSLLLRPQLGRRALGWPIVVGAAWALGWAVVTALTGVLPVALHRLARRDEEVAS